MFSYNIYRKPTTTDTIIPYDSCHPHEHKLAAIRYLVNRANTYDLDTEKKEAEINTIKQIIRNNGYDASTTETVNHTEHRQRKKTHDSKKWTKKWTKFTYVGKETRQITKFFRNTQVSRYT